MKRLTLIGTDEEEEMYAVILMSSVEANDE
jgi:hypothetical protein